MFVSPPSETEMLSYYKLRGPGGPHGAPQGTHLKMRNNSEDVFVASPPARSGGVILLCKDAALSSFILFSDTNKMSDYDAWCWTCLASAAMIFTHIHHCLKHMHRERLQIREAEEDVALTEVLHHQTSIRSSSLPAEDKDGGATSGPYQLQPHSRHVKTNWWRASWSQRRSRTRVIYSDLGSKTEALDQDGCWRNAAQFTATFKTEISAFSFVSGYCATAAKLLCPQETKILQLDFIPQRKPSLRL